jgi:hypothetical protein
MLAPQFTLRRLLGVVSICALACCALGFAARGQLWAVAVAMALFGFVVMMGCYVLVYTVVRLMGMVVERRRHARRALSS